MEERVILVDRMGREIGTEEKLKAHREGKLHRAFSVFVFNSLGELLLQKRSKNKYHSGGLWTNTCCSHPHLSESHHCAARRRLVEEMGFDCELTELFSFIYHAEVENNLFEHELDHVFVGHYDGQPVPNPDEVDDWKWMDINRLRLDVGKNPDHYTYWFKLVLNRVLKQYENASSWDET
ncbi:isopentenyl-diphosphate delta-isomerase [Candidatus Poribacteria bacterium]|nr:MAG: isopentenyl-diphosphate delta-isomerase [Candidatus Poribacteria bacterium]